MDINENGITYTREESINISNKFEKMLKNYRSKGTCMYCKCTNNSINSHTISKKGSLSTISVDNEVGCFVSRRNGLEQEFNYNKVNINNVTTFKGFCSTHDNQLFECIDNNSEIKTGKEILLQSYRSICKSLFDEGYYPFLESSELLNIEMIKEYIKLDESLNTISLSDSQIMSIYNSIINEHKDKLLESREILLNYKKSIEKDIQNNFTDINIKEISCTKSKITKTSDENVTILYNWFDWRIPVSIFNSLRLKGKKSVDCILNFTYIPYKNSSEVFWIFLNKDFDFFYNYWNWFISKKINILNTIESCMMALENWCIDPKIIADLPEERKNVLFKDMFFNNERTNIWEEYDMSIFDDIRIELITSNMCNVTKEYAKLNEPDRQSDEIRKKEYEKTVFNML